MAFIYHCLVGWCKRYFQHEHNYAVMPWSFQIRYLGSDTNT